MPTQRSFLLSASVVRAVLDSSQQPPVRSWIALQSFRILAIQVSWSHESCLGPDRCSKLGELAQSDRNAIALAREWKLDGVRRKATRPSLSGGSLEPLLVPSGF